ncbi:unnamed protein product [Cyprideis torosa]|uniref:Uncharacterized protein n=1 Tax=Cyprideis torosa TaxID=163714 RepID=A0A7R8ZP38_9CRUS|nr:unnamed protein product [Cyprideis torosa]CAG0893011.1 unnamed protein product [Cyprideis torosa]
MTPAFFLFLCIFYTVKSETIPIKLGEFCNEIGDYEQFNIKLCQDAKESSPLFCDEAASHGYQPGSESCDPNLEIPESDDAIRYIMSCCCCPAQES